MKMTHCRLALDPLDEGYVDDYTGQFDTLEEMDTMEFSLPEEIVVELEAGDPDDELLAALYADVPLRGRIAAAVRS